jgi:RimJ/RimL family protein N-acetyltransferase
MVGDINLFFHNYIEENEAEIDIMIGEKKFRNKGYA